MTPRALLHGLSLALPLFTLLYVGTGPHRGPAIPLLASGVILLSVALDRVASPERRPPHSDAPTWVFDGALYVHVVVQLCNVITLARFAAAGPSAGDLVVGIVLVGASSGYSAIVVAHELIHRRSKRMQLLGRLLLTTVLYEHFYTEHIRGHHVRIGTDEDPATARYGERLWPFVLRTVPAQFRSAWRLEAKRVGDAEMGLFDRRILRSRVLRGFVTQWTVVGLLAAGLGLVPALAYVLQAAIAVLLLEAVNYVEHWGLRRQAKRVSTVDSWDSESWFTYYTLVGLSRHADHHANASRPYQLLRHFEESPKMPYGYWGMVVQALVWDRPLIARLDAELRARGLGPYQGDPGPAGV
ncbi:MAG: alkane 1-monooxygenase [Deltaproteobacteria bacterium]|nr:MAG: alkane 1-monooxygenase [Deltaproteobacteria bacterium]